MSSTLPLSSISSLHDLPELSARSSRKFFRFPFRRSHAQVKYNVTPEQNDRAVLPEIDKKDIFRYAQCNCEYLKSLIVSKRVSLHRLLLKDTHGFTAFSYFVNHGLPHVQALVLEGHFSLSLLHSTSTTRFTLKHPSRKDFYKEDCLSKLLKKDPTFIDKLVSKKIGSISDFMDYKDPQGFSMFHVYAWRNAEKFTHFVESNGGKSSAQLLGRHLTTEGAPLLATLIKNSPASIILDWVQRDWFTVKDLSSISFPYDTGHITVLDYFKKTYSKRFNDAYREYLSSL